jgi:hypothetical protein
MVTSAWTELGSGIWIGLVTVAIGDCYGGPGEPLRSDRIVGMMPTKAPRQAGCFTGPTIEPLGAVKVLRVVTIIDDRPIDVSDARVLGRTKAR